MPTISEMDAAVALLELHRGAAAAPQSQSSQSVNELENSVIEAMFKRRRLEVTRVTSSPSSPKQPTGSPQRVIKVADRGCILRNNNNQRQFPEVTRHNQTETLKQSRLNLHKRYLEEQRLWSEERNSNINDSSVTNVQDVTGVTDQNKSHKQIELVSALSKLSECVNELENLKRELREVRSSAACAKTNEVIAKNGESERFRRNYLCQAKAQSSSTNSILTRNEKEDREADDSDTSDEANNSIDDEDSPYKNKRVLKNKTGNSDMVTIGDGNASVPARLLKQMNWTSYTTATRKLLTAVFSRRVLATHSLTGKPSPAFPDKPAKKPLDPDLVNDIVQTVCDRCNVQENLVRTSITTKCADESKMFRCREKSKKRRQLKKENVKPRHNNSYS